MERVLDVRTIESSGIDFPALMEGPPVKEETSRRGKKRASG
jgi:hypothetical protein